MTDLASLLSRVREAKGPLKKKDARKELAKIATALGEPNDPFAAWERLEAVLATLRFYAAETTYSELTGDDAERLKVPAYSMVNIACLTSGNGRIKVEVPTGHCVPPILGDWGKRARALLTALQSQQDAE